MNTAKRQNDNPTEGAMKVLETLNGPGYGLPKAPDAEFELAEKPQDKHSKATGEAKSPKEKKKREVTTHYVDELGWRTSRPSCWLLIACV